MSSGESRKTGADTAHPSFLAPMVEPDGWLNWTAFLLSVNDPTTTSGFGYVRIYIKDGQPPPSAVNERPVAKISAPNSAKVNKDVAFSGAGSSDPDGTIVLYAWDFGDGASGSGARVTHRYRSSAKYTVTLAVTDDGGATGTGTHRIKVGAGK